MGVNPSIGGTNACKPCTSGKLRMRCVTNVLGIRVPLATLLVHLVMAWKRQGTCQAKQEGSTGCKIQGQAVTRATLIPSGAHCFRRRISFQLFTRSSTRKAALQNHRMRRYKNASKSKGGVAATAKGCLCCPVRGKPVPPSCWRHIRPEPLDLDFAFRRGRLWRVSRHSCAGVGVRRR